MWSKDLIDSLHFSHITHWCGCSMCIDVVDICLRNTCILKGSFDALGDSLAIFTRCSHVESITTDASSEIFAENRSATRLCMLQTFNKKYTRSLTHDKSIALTIPGTGGFFRLFVIFR